MKYLLIPFTLMFWYITAYYGIYYSLLLCIYLSTLSWLWIIVAFPILIGITFTLTNSIPGLIRHYILKLYNFNLFSSIAHSIAGIVGVFSIFYFFYNNPPEVVNNDTSVFILKALWQDSPLKTLLLSISFFGIATSLIWSTIFSPFIVKTEEEI
jgi:hypothetical protein